MPIVLQHYVKHADGKAEHARADHKRVALLSAIGREKRKSNVTNLVTTEFGQKKRAKNNKGGLRSIGSCVSCHYRHQKCIWMDGELQCDKCPLLSEDSELPPCPCFKYVGPGQGRRTDLRKSLLLDNSRTCRQAFVLWCQRSVETEIVRVIHCL